MAAIGTKRTNGTGLKMSGIEGKGDSPLTVSRAEPQFFHVRVTRAPQRVNAGPPQLWPELLEEPSQR